MKNEAQIKALEAQIEMAVKEKQRMENADDFFYSNGGYERANKHIRELRVKLETLKQQK